MTDYRITTNQNSLSTANGDNTFVAPGVTVNGGIDMRGNNGGDQTVNLFGTFFGEIDDYFGSSSGGDQIFVGATGSVSIDWFGAVMLGGGGNILVNSGTISSMSYGDAIYMLGSVGGHQTERDTITNTGTISSTDLHPDRTWADATIYISDTAGVTIANTGLILSSSGYAMSLTTGDDTVTNSGLIQGGVMLGDGTNFFDSRPGMVTGPVIGGSGNDTIYGGKGDDMLIGGAGNDRLDGYLGADTMIGGPGDDSYYVDNTGDFVDENNATYGGGGNDTIYSSISFDLSNPAQVNGAIEHLVLTGAADIDAIGTAGSETITGNIGRNTITGGGGNDALNGGGGNDILYGGDGNDILLGGAGNDTLYGGGGNDTLNGGLGIDVMQGGAGNDTYVFDNTGDVADESAPGSGGIDKILSSVNVSLSDSVHVKGAIENLTLLGSAALAGTGNALANTILGNAGRNTLDGKLGNDVLTGGAGADRFVFSTALNAATNRDTITDFQHGIDKIALDRTVSTKFTTPGPLLAANFAINAPHDANDYIIYNTTTGALSYDSNGNGPGASTQFATLTHVPGITQADFLIF